MARGNPHPVVGFQKGKSGNPSGRPKSNLSSLLAKYLMKEDPISKKKHEQILVEKIVELGEGGDKEALEFIWDRMEGKVQQQLDMKSGGAPLTFTLSLGDPNKGKE